MLSEPQRDLMRDKGTTLGRVLIGALFLVSGIRMLMDSSTSADLLMSMGVPLASVAVGVVIAIKIAAGGAIVLGKRVGLAAATLIGLTALSTLINYVGMGETSFDTASITNNLALIGGLLYLMAYGPGGSNTTKLASA